MSERPLMIEVRPTVGGLLGLMVSYLGFMMTVVALATDETSALQLENRLGRQVHLHPELEQNHSRRTNYTPV